LSPATRSRAAVVVEGFTVVGFTRQAYVVEGFMPQGFARGVTEEVPSRDAAWLIVVGPIVAA